MTLGSIPKQNGKWEMVPGRPEREGNPVNPSRYFLAQATAKSEIFLYSRDISKN